jgi:hypothetical protein
VRRAAGNRSAEISRWAGEDDRFRDQHARRGKDFLARRLGARGMCEDGERKEKDRKDAAISFGESVHE